MSGYSGAPAHQTWSKRAERAGTPLRERTIRQRAWFTPPTSASEEAA